MRLMSAASRSGDLASVLEAVAALLFEIFEIVVETPLRRAAAATAIAVAPTGELREVLPLPPAAEIAAFLLSGAAIFGLLTLLRTRFVDDDEFDVRID